MSKSIGFIGGGRITAIFLAAWKDSGLALGPVVVSDGDPEVLARLQARFPEIQVTGDNRVPAGRELVFLSLHPPVAREVLPALAGSLLPGALVVSLAPVLTFERLSTLLGGFQRLARMIDLGQRAPAQRQIAKDAGGQLPDHSRAQQQLMADQLGLCRGLAQSSPKRTR